MSKDGQKPTVPEIFLKPYDPAASEVRAYAQWEASGYFNPDNLPGLRTEPFTIVMPPPNANGRLHAGHALFITLEDIMIRYKRMRGYKALWVPGADHAGFETQIVYEKQLEKEGRSRFDMEPADLYKEIYDFTIENKKHMESDVRRIGASCDWSREHFTLEPKVVKTVQETFQKMFADGLVYRGSRIVNWCARHQTSLSDVETEYVEQADTFYYLQYGPFVIATARPETKFGDKYVVMHPDDERYTQYKDGDTFELEWINGPITATVVKDEAIDMSFGSGVMTITPWHDQVDFDIAQRHGLDKEQVIDFKGKLLPMAGEFAGMHISKARALIVDKLRQKGLVVKTEDTYLHSVRVCYKCNTPIEPQIKEQWFVRMQPLAEKALQAVQEGKITFIPDNYRSVFNYWMTNTIDWNISRQIVWGIPIPAFRHAETGEWKAETDPDKQRDLLAQGYIADTDTFDTWFSSGQWTLLSLGYPAGTDLDIYHPTDVMETGHDLIFKWIPRMVIFSLYLRGEVPFKTVYLHGLVNDAHGKKMSKSKGNVISPIDLIDKYGADALRMALIVGNTPGSDLSLSEQKINGYKKFSNKLWNIARFVISMTEGYDMATTLTERDRELKKQFEAIAGDITKDLDEFRFHLASEKIYHYIWHNFADEIIEESKPVLFHGSDTDKASRAILLHRIFTDCLKLLHPFMPFVTETIWQNLPEKESDLLMVAQWPSSSIV